MIDPSAVSPRGSNGDPVRVDAVVVSYNSRERLRACVEPLTATHGVHVVVVDNASPDRSLEAVAGLPVTTIASPRNGGFAHGCNLGWRAGSAPFVLLLNPDARIDADSLERLVEALRRDPALGVVGPRVLEEDGALSLSQRRFPRLRSTFAQALFLHRLLPRAVWTDETLRDPLRYARPAAPEWISGACMLLPRAALERVQGLDDGFFLYCEDKDLCQRLRRAGLGVRYEPAAVCRHAGGASAPRSALLAVLAESRIRYARKHRGRPAAAAERVGIALGAVTHLVVARGARRAGHMAALRATLRAGRGVAPRGAAWLQDRHA